METEIVELNGSRQSRWSANRICLIALLLSCACALLWFFTKRSEMQTLQRSVTSLTENNTDRRIHIKAGGFVLGAARRIASFFHPPAELQTAMDALRDIDVAYYKLHQRQNPQDCSVAFERARSAMESRRWDRLVSVSQHGMFVAVFTPRNVRPGTVGQFCVMTLEGNNLVIAAGNVALEGLIRYAREEMARRSS
jgi:hypothetical protein